MGIYQNIVTINKVVQGLFNQQKHSDVVFVVNNTQYYANKAIITGYSNAIQVMIDEQLQEFEKEIIIPQVKYNESFLSILKYMYGVAINFDRMKQMVTCEILNLAKTYKLIEFYQDVKCYLSKLKGFEMDSLIMLINTAKTHEIHDLYERLKIIMFKQTEAIVMHESFVRIQYNVLLDLIQSNWFYTTEKDILRCVLNWHHVNIIDVKPRGVAIEDYETESITSDDTETSKYSHLEDLGIKEEEEEEDEREDGKEEGWDGNASGNIEIETSNEDIITGDINKTDENFNENVTDATENEGQNKRNEEMKNKTTDLVASFSENIIRTLMKHIRVPRIVIADLINDSEGSYVELFDKYKNVISDLKKAQLNHEPRLPYVSEVTTKQYVIPGIERRLVWGKLYFSKKTCCISNFEFDIFVERALYVKPTGSKQYLEIYMSCKPGYDYMAKCWECYVGCKLRLISRSLFREDHSEEKVLRFSSAHNIYRFSEFIEISDFYHANNAFIEEKNILVEVNFNQVEVNVLKNHHENFITKYKRISFDQRYDEVYWKSRLPIDKRLQTKQFLFKGVQEDGLISLMSHNTHWVEDMLFQLVVMKSNSLDSTGEKYLKVFLNCTFCKNSTNWECDVTYEIRLISINPFSKAHRSALLNYSFSSEQDLSKKPDDSRVYSIYFADLENPGNEFIENGCVLFEVNFVQVKCKAF